MATALRQPRPQATVTPKYHTQATMTARVDNTKIPYPGHYDRKGRLRVIPCPGHYDRKGS